MNGVIPGTGRFTPLGSGGAGTAALGNRTAACAAETFLRVAKLRPPTSAMAAAATVAPAVSRNDRRPARPPPAAHAGRLAAAGAGWPATRPSRSRPAPPGPGRWSSACRRAAPRGRSGARSSSSVSASPVRAGAPGAGRLVSVPVILARAAPCVPPKTIGGSSPVRRRASPRAARPRASSPGPSSISRYSANAPTSAPNTVGSAYPGDAPCLVTAAAIPRTANSASPANP